MAFYLYTEIYLYTEDIKERGGILSIFENKNKLFTLFSCFRWENGFVRQLSIIFCYELWIHKYIFYPRMNVHLLFCHSDCCGGSWGPEHLVQFSLWHLWRLWQTLFHSWCYHCSRPSQTRLLYRELVHVCEDHSCTSSAPPGCRHELERTRLPLRRWRRQTLLLDCLREKDITQNQKVEVP